MHVPGIEIQLGDAKRILPPLNATAYKQHRDAINSIFTKTGALPDVALVALLAHAALQRNYPDLTLEEVEKHIDFGNMVEMLDAVMNISGLVASTGKVMRRTEASPPASSS